MVELFPRMHEAGHKHDIYAWGVYFFVENDRNAFWFLLLLLFLGLLIIHKKYQL